MSFYISKPSLRILLLSMFILLSFGSIAQIMPGTPSQAILENVFSKDWILIKDGVKITAAQFITNYKATLKIGKDDALRFSSSATDAIGNRHDKYQRLYKGYPIDGCMYLFHSKGDDLTAVNGGINTAIQGRIAISISATQGLERAKLFFPAAQYAWENLQLEKDKKEMMHDDNATFYPRPALVWQTKTGSALYTLCFQIDLVKTTLEAKRVFVSAASGEIVNSYMLSTGCIGTSVSTSFYGTRTINTRQITLPFVGSKYYLWDDCVTAFIRTRRKFGSDTSDYSSTNNFWANERSAVSSQWAVKEAYNYFLNIHGRQSWNNASAGNYIYQLPGTQNAFSLSGNLSFGEGNAASNLDDWSTLDIVAHEYAHGVTESSSGLVYEKESGALNESFSDIFGTTCYANFFGFNSNIWKIGYERKNINDGVTSLYIRNMSNPNDKNDPDTYFGTNWVTTTTNADPGDYWGVHTNSGVQNYMFYLLVTGGSGVNDNFLSYNVGGIGLVDARRIAYMADTYYLAPRSGFANARDAWVQAARTIFGSCSNQAIQTGKAWDAVGLPPPDRSYNYVGNYTVTSNFGVSGTANLASPSAMTIQSGAQVSVAARRVIMSPGFKALPGSYFHAYYGDCFFTAL